MELRQIKYFITLAEIGSVSKASSILSVAQPAISRQIRNLEEELGVDLFYRNGRGMELTDAGRLFLKGTSRVVGDLRQVIQEVKELRGTAAGQVVLGLPPTESHLLVMPLIERLRAHHPGIVLQVVEAFSGFVNEWLTNGRLDVALFYEAPRTGHLVTEELLRESLYLVGAKGKPRETGPLDITDLEGEKLILPSKAHSLRLLVDRAAAKHSVTVDVQLEIDAFLTIKDMVETGSWSTILPYHSVQKEVEAGLLWARPIRMEQLERILVLATSTQRPLTMPSRIVARELREMIREMVQSGLWPGALFPAAAVPEEEPETL